MHALGRRYKYKHNYKYFPWANRGNLRLVVKLTPLLTRGVRKIRP